jgi:ApaG protein
MEKNNRHGFIIRTQASYLPDQSDEPGNRFVFSYTINITNLGSNTVKLIGRHWVITDANHHIHEVRGQGVVGEQPSLNTNQSFEYTSGTVLSTQVGTMRGTYQMQTVDGKEFDIEIPQFVLSVPRVLH